MITAATLHLAVVPIIRRPSGGQWFFSYLPAIIVLVLLVLLFAVCRRIPWARLPRHMWIALVAVIAIAGLAYFVPGFRNQPPPPPIDTDAGQWPTFMGNAQRVGHTDDSRGPVAGLKIWSYQDTASRAAFAASAAIVDGRVYVGCDNRYLYCLSADTGQFIWKFKAACELFASPVIAGGRVYLGEGLHESNNARLYCLDATSGRKLWEFATAGHIEFSPTLLGGKLYVAAGPDGVYCLNADTGAKLWQYASAHVDQSPAVSEHGVFFGSVYESPAFYCLNPYDGQVMWKRPASTDVCGSPSTDGQRVYFGLGNGSFGMSHAKPVGAVACLSAVDGNLLWTTTHVKDAVLTTAAFWQGAVYFGSRDGHLYCVNADTGQPRWAFAAQDAIVSSPAVVDGRVYFGCNDGLVYAVDALTGSRLWAYDTSQAAFSSDVQVMASPAIAGGRLYIGSANGHFFCIGGAAASTTRQSTSR